METMDGNLEKTDFGMTAIMTKMDSSRTDMMEKWSQRRRQIP